MAGRPVAGRRPGAADLARLRAQRARAGRDRGPGRGARRLASRHGAGPRRERPGAAPGDARADGPARRSCAIRDQPATRIGLDALLARAPGPRLRAGPRGRRAGRVRATRRHRRRVPAVGRRSRSGSSSSATRSTRLRAFDPTDQRSVGTVERRSPCCPRPSSCCRPAAPTRSGHGSAGSARRLPERLALDLARFAGEATSPERPARRPTERPRARRRRRRRGLVAASSPRRPASTTSTPDTLFVLDEPGDLADAAEFLWRQADERHRELVEQGELPKDWPQRLPPGARLEGAPPRRADPGAHVAVRGPGGAGHGVRLEGPDVGRPVRLARARPAARTDGAARRRRRALARRAAARRPGVSDQAPRLAELLGEAGHPVGIVGRIAEPPPPGAIALDRAQPQRRLRGRPGRPRARHGPRAVRHRPRPAAQGDAPGRAARHPRAADARATWSSTSTTASPATSRCSGAARRARSATTWSCSFAAGDRIFVPVEQINRVSRYSGGEHPQLSRLGGTDWLRTKQRVRKAVNDLAEELLAPVREARGGPGLPVLGRLAVADGDGGVVPVRGDARPAARRRSRSRSTWRRAGRWTGWSCGDVGLRQDRGRAAGRVQGDPGRQAGRGARADDRARRAALHDVQPAVRRVPDDGEAAVAVRVGEGAGRRRSRGWRTGRSTS